MSDDENKVTDINEGMKRINHDKLIAQMDEAGISVQAQNESLTSLELIDLREYVMRGGWKEDGGVVISIVESAGTKPTDVQAGRLAFHTFGKELVLRKNIVQLGRNDLADPRLKSCERCQVVEARFVRINRRADNQLSARKSRLKQFKSTWRT